jgi:molecular chaperone GrpE
MSIEPEAPTAQTASAPDNATLQAEIERLQAEVAQLNEASLRERAELENLRRRIERDLEQSLRFANERLLRDLLPVFDSVEAGIQAAPESGPLREGLELTLRELDKLAGQHGLVAVTPAAGSSFDAQQHQAMGIAPAPGLGPNRVVQTVQKGYRLHQRLLRPAMVLVTPDD